MIEHAIVSLFDPREDATALIEVSEPEHVFGELGGLRPIPFEVELVEVRIVNGPEPTNIANSNNDTPRIYRLSTAMARPILRCCCRSTS